MSSKRFWFRLKILIDVTIFTGMGMYKSVMRNAYKINFFFSNSVVGQIIMKIWKIGEETGPCILSFTISEIYGTIQGDP